MCANKTTAQTDADRCGRFSRRSLRLLGLAGGLAAAEHLLALAEHVEEEVGEAGDVRHHDRLDEPRRRERPAEVHHEDQTWRRRKEGWTAGTRCAALPPDPGRPLGEN